MEENPFPTPTLDKPSGKRKKYIFLLFAIILVVLLVFLGTRFLGSNDGTEETEITPTPTEFVIPTDTPTPEVTGGATNTPTPTAKVTPTKGASSDSVDKASGLDRADLSVVVQNGSGEKGVAGSAKSTLEGLGYVVSSTGNADNFDYTDVTIKVKSAQKDFLAILKKDLATSYTIGSATSDLPASTSYDALIIIGK